MMNFVIFAMPSTDDGACVAVVMWSARSSLLLNFTCQLCFVRLSKIHNFVNAHHNSQNTSEGEEVLKSSLILAVGLTKKTGKTREILKSI